MENKQNLDNGDRVHYLDNNQDMSWTIALLHMIWLYYAGFSLCTMVCVQLPPSIVFGVHCDYMVY